MKKIYLKTIAILIATALLFLVFEYGNIKTIAKSNSLNTIEYKTGLILDRNTTNSTNNNTTTNNTVNNNTTNNTNTNSLTNTLTNSANSTTNTNRNSAISSNSIESAKNLPQTGEDSTVIYLIIAILLVSIILGAKLKSIKNK